MIRFSIAWFLLSTGCLACSCLGLPNCGGIGPGAHYVTGIPIARRIVPSTDATRFQRAVYTIRVSESFSKDIQSGSTIEIKTGLGGGDCGWVFNLDTAYLVDIYVNKDGSFGTNICSRTALISEARPLLEQLEAVKAGRRPPSLVGSIGEDRGVQDGYISEANVNFLAGIHLTARSSKGDLYSAITDSAGTFRFDVLPAGSYTLTPELPDRMKLWHSYTGEFDPAKVRIPQTAGVGEASCRAELTAEPAASIKGKVILPAADVVHTEVVAVLIRNGKETEVRNETPAADGAFALTYMPSGIYRIDVRTAGYRGRTRFSANVQLSDAQAAEITLRP